MVPTLLLTRTPTLLSLPASIAIEVGVAPVAMASSAMVIGALEARRAITIRRPVGVSVVQEPLKYVKFAIHKLRHLSRIKDAGNKGQSNTILLSINHLGEGVRRTIRRCHHVIKTVLTVGSFISNDLEGAVITVITQMLAG
jgi:hypothetical protein